ncbi:hypothetical protein [Gluconobacter roseus]|uniref:hypothetical protein n=1 Tax=Gluconobacter roseus TaxID=586239 RepID=UPI0038CFCAB2
MTRENYGVIEMHVLMCEQARREMKGTMNLIGVFSGEVAARNPSLPVVISLWINYRLKPNWRGILYLRLLDGEEVIAEDEADFSDLPYDVGELDLPPIKVLPVPARQLKFQYKTNEPEFSEWRTAKRIGLTVSENT